MGIYEQVNDALKEAMRARDAARTLALRNIRAAFIEALKVDNAASLPDDACVALLRRLAKQTQESIDAYASGQRDDLVAEERAKLAVYEGFLPQRASADDTAALVDAAIAATGAADRADLGRVMGWLMQHHKDRLDGKTAQAIARTRLGG